MSLNRSTTEMLRNAIRTERIRSLCSLAIVTPEFLEKLSFKQCLESVYFVRGKEDRLVSDVDHVIAIYHSYLERFSGVQEEQIHGASVNEFATQLSSQVLLSAFEFLQSHSPAIFAQKEATLPSELPPKAQVDLSERSESSESSTSPPYYDATEEQYQTACSALVSDGAGRVQAQSNGKQDDDDEDDDDSHYTNSTSIGSELVSDLRDYSAGMDFTETESLDFDEDDDDQRDPLRDDGQRDHLHDHSQRHPLRDSSQRDRLSVVAELNHLFRIENFSQELSERLVTETLNPPERVGRAEAASASLDHFCGQLVATVVQSGIEEAQRRTHHSMRCFGQVLSAEVLTTAMTQLGLPPRPLIALIDDRPVIKELQLVLAWTAASSTGSSLLLFVVKHEATVHRLQEFIAKVTRETIIDTVLDLLADMS